MKTLLPAVLLPLLLSACAAPMLGEPGASHAYASVNEDSRVQFLVLHYTEESWQTSLDILTNGRNSGGQASAHYLVRDEPVGIYQLVDENRRAWHAGASYWQGTSNLNPASIGIEIVNPGDKNLATGERNGQYAAFPPAQIDAVIRLVRDIVARHHIQPDRIVGHADVLPDDRRDPGPAFPWHRLYEAGLIPWPDATQVAVRQRAFGTALPSIAWAQERLARFGYRMPEPVSGVLDEHTRRVISAFQMRYRNTRFDGELDAETAALIEVATTPGGMRMAVPASQ